MKHTDLDQIEARAGAVPDGPWTLSDDLEGDGYPGHLWVVRTPASGPDEPDEYSAVVSIGDRALGEFIAHTREDVAALAAEIRRLRAERARYRTAWRMARTRALSTGGAADRYAARAREGQTALQDMLGALFAAQMELDEAQARVAALESVLAGNPAAASAAARP